MLIMHIGFLACFHAISLTQSFQQNRNFSFPALVALNLLVSLISRLVACSAIDCVQGSMVYSKPEGAGCSVPSAATALLRARGFNK